MARSDEVAPARKPRTRKPKETAPEEPVLEAVPDEVPEVEEPPAARGVFIIKSVDEQGNITTDTQPVGVEATEVQTIIELGLNGWRAKIGLDKR